MSLRLRDVCDKGLHAPCITATLQGGLCPARACRCDGLRRAEDVARFCPAILVAVWTSIALIPVVEDDEATGGFLAENLAADGFRVAAAACAGEALRRSKSASRRSSCSI